MRGRYIELCALCDVMLGDAVGSKWTSARERTIEFMLRLFVCCVLASDVWNAE